MVTLRGTRTGSPPGYLLSACSWRPVDISGLEVGSTDWPALALQAHQWVLSLFYEALTYGPQHHIIREVIKPVAASSFKRQL